MEKYGAICCPRCHSPEIKAEGFEKIAVRSDLLKVATTNTGGRFLCRKCGLSFNQVTNDMQASDSAGG